MRKPLDLLRARLKGSTLIEASAGTGKTYSLAALFLRYIVEEGFKVEEILVVTFTEAATEELRGRIRARLKEALALFAVGESDDEFLKGLLAKCVDHELARRRIVRALASFDEAPIFTIHSFCGRVLAQSAFECGAPFEREVSGDSSSALEEVVGDYWRVTVGNLPVLVKRRLQEKRIGVGELSKFAGKWRARQNMTLIPDGGDPWPESLEGSVKSLFESFSSLWLESRGEVARLIQESPAVNKRSYSRKNLPRWVDLVTSYAAGSDPFSAPEELLRFSNSGLEDKRTGEGALPVHKIFDLAEELVLAIASLERAVNQTLLSFKMGAIKYLREHLPKWKSEHRLRHFDDLILELRDALASDGGEALAVQLRSRYRAALIDEFQDTDPVQYEIFSRIFGAGHPLFIIGDPKQAIYSFRGADVYTYMHAAKETEQANTLDKNYRSSPALVRGVNTLFGAYENPFLVEEIKFEPAIPGLDGDPSFTVDGVEDAPLKVCHILRGDGKLSTADAARRAMEYVTAEILTLLGGVDGEAALADGKPLRAEDIAVLSNTHDNARALQGMLLSRGVPAVIYDSESVFSSSEARELYLLLRAIEEPGYMNGVRGALATSLIGLDARQIKAVEEGEGWEEWLLRVLFYHRLWHERGFIQMSRALIDGEGIRARLLASDGGERRLTNLLHIVELLGHAAVEGKLGAAGVTKHLAAKLAHGGKSEEHEMRIESDANAVRILTVHKSKGLEYPVVFVPFSYEVMGRRAVEAFCHDPSDSMKGILNIDPDSPEYPEHREAALAEQRAERVRALYVALTRGSRRTYFFCGPIDGSEGSGVATLLTPESDPAQLGDDGYSTIVEGLAEGSSGSIEVRPVGPLGGLPPSCIYQPAGEKAEALRVRIPRANHSARWSVESFSSISKGAHSGLKERPDRDEFTSQGGDSEEAEGIFAFPKGARAGNLFHAILEEVSFTGGAKDRLHEVRRNLGRFGFGAEWESVVADSIERTLAAPLGWGFSLSDLDDRDRVSELEFFLPMKYLSSSALSDLFARYGTDFGGEPSLDFLETIAKLGFGVVRGYLRGFIDLTFRHGGRYYIVDWKSNHLGNTAADYGYEGMALAMNRSGYHLQYHLYLAALHRYLAARLPGYSYAECFGGVAYLFLRGIGRGEAGCGIYRARPAKELIVALADLLMDGEVK
ncbi:MAG: exodeoxyribonuclease V subunit beta [Deltaproteobacteria bacterium]|nr:MAG: exodeoxyribonuclease V subunit beta [Deltaproteobacteria bacterium]